MVNQIFIPNPVQPGRLGHLQQPKPASGQTVNSPFAQILDQKLPAEGVKFSQHAQDRLRARNITFSAAELANLEGAVTSVAQKGGKESLVMMGDSALVVSVKNRTVVTALDRAQMRGSVFTYIDSAVFI